MRLSINLRSLTIVVMLTVCVGNGEAQRRTTSGASAGIRTDFLDERQVFLNSARTAWAFVDRNYQAS
ncbi:MAG: hypothetical protein ACJ77J_10070, partial [Gemmatimonadaceae bacterium]